MFAWANATLNNLAETLAPPPDTPDYSFLHALKQDGNGPDAIDWNAILGSLSDIDAPLNTTGNQKSGRFFMFLLFY